MNLYLITRNDRVGWDEYDSAVIAAPNEEIAISFIVKEMLWGWQHNPEQQLDVTAKLVGTTTPDIEAGILIASFNAG